MKKSDGIRAGRIRLKYEEKRIYLGYHPDYQLAKEFYYCRNTKGFIWDFSIHTFQELKYQVFTVLNYALESLSDCELRRGVSCASAFLYMYCIDRGISELTRLEQDQIDDYVGKAKEVPLINNRYHQIVDILDKDNREYLKMYIKYQLGVTSYSVQNIWARVYITKAFLRFLDKEKLKVEKLEIDRYMRLLQEEDVEIITFNVTIQNHPYSKMKSGWPEIAFLIAS